ncbi:hypothetical protein QBC37DRAFT_44100 [Rhypophila decipiens]|uniref:F-box domain-containing protein n=1 Tax=Rhypophila decipiens TaxID=261697 RepID=A0AAN7B4F1_9PEZI|nr:hypothetical protein QBC37DRAFT_44100 [Rhypophila decipiens]
MSQARQGSSSRVTPVWIRSWRNFHLTRGYLVSVPLPTVRGPPRPHSGIAISSPASTREQPSKTPSSPSPLSTVTATINNLPTAGINKLPQELIDQVLEGLSTRDKARLARCNKNLYSRTLKSLYASFEDRHAAVEWACRRGVVSTLDRAFSRGAPVSTVYMLAGDGEKRLTLDLALKSRRRGVFTYLVEQGARFDVPNVGSRLFTEKFFDDDRNLAVVGWFLEAGLASQLGQSARNQALGYVLRLSSPAHTSRKGIARIDRDPARTRDHIRELLDAGADPNSTNLVSVSAHYNEFGNRLSRSTSPLSSAIQADRPDPVRILIDRGANVDGRLTALVKKPPALPHHVPVCAAAFTMHGTRGTGFEFNATTTRLWCCSQYLRTLLRY